MGHQHSQHLRHRLGVSDVRALLRLCNQLHVLAASGAGGVGERDGRKLKLLEGVRALTDADRVSSAVATFRDADKPGRASDGQDRRTSPGTEAADGDHPPEPAVVSAVHLGPPGPTAPTQSDPPAEGRPGYVPCPWHAYRAYGRDSRGANAPAPPWVDWCTSATGATPAGHARAARARRAKRAGAEHVIHCFIPLSDGHVAACLSVGRDPARPRFSWRERSIVCALHPEVAWLYRADVMLLSPETRALSPRERETLEHLLAGKAEKQIAHQMGVKFNTIHHYVKSLHRHFGVSTRSELLAQWVGR